MKRFLMTRREVVGPVQREVVLREDTIDQRRDIIEIYEKE